MKNFTPAPKPKKNKKKPYKGLKRTGTLKKTPLKKVSAKQSRILQSYYEKKKVYMRHHPNCEMPNCNRKAVDLHHKAGRGKNTDNESTFMAVCRCCHDLIHSNANWARKEGYLI